jgi:hypothetical protein
MAAGLAIRQVFLVLFATQLVSIGVSHTTDPDMWWHLRTGELIWNSGIPRHDPFSFTVTGGAWTTHEWLSEAFMWALYAAGGLKLLSIGFGCLSGLAFWLVYRCCPGQPYLAALPTVLGAFAASGSFGARPQVLNMLFMAAFVYVVEGVRSGVLDRRVLWWLPVSTVAWVNFHSGYLLGVVLLATYAAGEAFEAWLARRRQGRVDVDLARRLAWVAVACLAAALFNPSGWHIWLYPFDTLGSDLMQQNIIEWSSPDFHKAIYWPFAALMGLGVFAFAVSPKRPTAPDVLLFLGTAAAGLMSRRHIALFAIATIPVIARALSEALRSTAAYSFLCQPRQEELTRTKVRLNLLIVLVGMLATVSWRLSTLAGNEESIAKVFPVAAVDHLTEKGMADERGFNSYPWGGYLIWRGLPVFIDGRADVYGDFLGVYLQTLKLQDNWREPLERFDVDYVIIERYGALATLLAAVDDWRLEYSDDVARIFVRERRPRSGKLTSQPATPSAP